MIEKIKEDKLVWRDLIIPLKTEDSIIEYIDAEEQNTSMICMKPNLFQDNYTYTHCEIHPSTIFGVLASCIPFP